MGNATTKTATAAPPAGVHTAPTELRRAGTPAPAVAWPLDRARLRRRAALADLAAIAVGVTAAHLVRYGSPHFADLDAITPGLHHALTSLILTVLWIGGLRAARTLDPWSMGSGRSEYARVAGGTFVVFGAFASTAYVVGWEVGRAWVGIAFPLGLGLLLVGRWCLRRVLVRERRRGKHLAKALVVGGRESVAQLVGELDRAPEEGFIAVAACVTASDDREIADVPVVGDVEDAAAYASCNGLDAIVVAGADALTPRTLKNLAWALEPAEVALVLAPGLTGVAESRLMARSAAGPTLLRLGSPGYTASHRWLKRAFDVVASTLLIGLVALPLAVTALAIKMTSRGPVLYRQTRIGAGGAPFRVLKFRSMCVDADSRLSEVLDGDAGIFYKPTNDPRVTTIGKFIRRYSIDELPQLFNVLGGSMSLVGPRPQVPLEVAQYDDEISRRLLVRPGITGLWQVSGRNGLTLEQSVRLDLYYVENWTLLQDLTILARTIKAVVSSDGAS